jgi:hypothetical protein
MFKKLNIKVLLILFVVLAGVVVIINLTGKKERTFRSTVMEFDPELINGMKVHNPTYPDVIAVNKQDNEMWEVSSEGKSYRADKATIENMLSMLSELKTERIAATAEEKWEEFHVSDESGIRVELLSDEDVIVDIVIGKFSYKMLDQPAQGQQQFQQQQQAKMTSYLRHTDDEEVYAVEGILRMNFTSGIEFFRSKNLVGKRADEISKVSFEYPDQLFFIERNADGWMLDGQAADSLKTARFVQKLSGMRSSEFLDNIALGSSVSEMHLTIEGVGFEPIEIDFYPAADTNIKYYVTSSFNPGSIFNGEKGKLMEKAIVDRERFILK